jgi:chemotaxis methyl-accepting protein methylase
MYLEKATQNNLGYSKMLSEFLLEKNAVDGETTNLGKLIRMTCITDTNFFRNLNFLPEFKIDILREAIVAVNENTSNVSYLSEMIINFSGKM